MQKLIFVSSTKRNETESLLLRLPAELRNQIYTFALHQATLHVRTPPLRLRAINDGVGQSQTCVQLRSETKNLLDGFSRLRLLNPLVAHALAEQRRGSQQYPQVLMLEMDHHFICTTRNPRIAIPSFSRVFMVPKVTKVVIRPDQLQEGQKKALVRYVKAIFVGKP